MIDRRTLIAGGSALALSACVAAPARPSDAIDFADLQARLGAGGRLGVAAIDTGTGSSLAYQADQRFAFCSTFKLILAAAILKQVERGNLRLDQPIAFTEADMLFHAPVTRPALDAGRLPLERLTQAIVEVSDNPAANLLLKLIGGPAGLTAFMRSLGDPVSRLDRWELSLNQNLAGDPRDTTTPAAMAATMRQILAGRLISEENKARLYRWLSNASTGLDRLRGGLPAGWRAGDKTGTGANGANNDVAIAWPPGRPPVLIACFMSEGTADNRERAAVHAEVARRIAAAFS